MIEDETAKVRQIIALEKESYRSISDAVQADIDRFKIELLSDPGLLQEQHLFNKWKPEPNQDLIEATYALFIKSWLLGMAHTASPATDFADTPPDLEDVLPYEEAIKWAKGRISLTREQFYALSDQMKRKAFTVGRLAQLDMIEKVKQIYLEDMASSSSSLVDFIATVTTSVDRLGLPSYYETVYRTNIQTDYNAGRAAELDRDPPLYLEFIGIEDVRQTPICSARSGVILPYDDPWWETNWPPLHFNCRSTIRAIYKEEADALGISPTARPRISSKAAVQKGFGAKPNLGSYAPTAGQQKRIDEFGVSDELSSI